MKFGNLTKESFQNDLKSIASEFNNFKSKGAQLEIKIKRFDGQGGAYKSFLFDCKITESIGCQILPL